ncbi:MAG: ABC transporter ATP-binding protein [Thaumarchaeota archaeon]|nr:ABC transporter ATP-binding protein [Nitrososphaerota archaeon]
MTQVLELNAAVKNYGSKTIGPITFSVGKGEVVGLLGPNGSGKSTSIRLALGLARPTSGSARLMGLDPVREHSKALAGVGYSPELPNLQTFMTPVELLMLIGRELSLDSSEMKAQIPKVLEDVGLLNYQDYKIGKLSKGMVQRLSVAQSMLGSPSLLILDEPMIGIDPAGAVHFRALFRDFVARGGTIILSSHIMSEVEALCTSLAVLHSGSLIYRGAIGEFISGALTSRVINVEVQSATEGLAATVGKIPGVLRVTATDAGFSVEMEKGSDVRGEVSNAVVESGAKLLSIGYSRSELDEAYMAAIRGSSD